MHIFVIIIFKNLWAYYLMLEKPRPNILQRSPLQSQPQKLQTYLNFIAINNLQDLQALKSSIIKCLPKSISYDSEAGFEKKMVSKIVNHTANYQFIDVEVKLGYFTFSKISIVNMKGKSPAHQIAHKGSGSFCTVYKCRFKNLNLAFKCFPKRYTETEVDEVRLKLLLEQFCIAKLASCLQIGPRMYDSLGYDIMVYEDCIQFCMEKCELLPENYSFRVEEISADLKDNLRKIHAINIVHRDIKIDNICYSRQFNKFVFIDFGFSQILEESCGLKSFTWFRGTFDYCSLQMRKLSLQKNGKQVDLYYNDLCGLKITLQNLKQRKESYNISKMIQYDAQNDAIQANLTESYKLVDLKYQIFQQQRPTRISIQRLNLDQMLQLRRWMSQLYDSTQNRRICSFIKSIIREKAYNQIEYQQKEQEESLNIQNLNLRTYNQLGEINQHSRYYYFLNQFHSNFIGIINQLKKTHQIQVQSQDYLCLMSKAIQFNASELKQQILEELCNAAFNKYSALFLFKEQLQKVGIIHVKPSIQLSKFLFIAAFKNKLKGKYYFIFSSIVNNIFFYGILDTQEIMHYYKTLLQMPLHFKIKIKALVAFYSALEWKYFISDQFDQYILIKALIHKENTSFREKMQQAYCEDQMFVFTVLLCENEPLNQISLSPTLEQQDTEIKIWLIYRILKEMRFNYQLFEQMQNYSQKQHLKQTSIFQYYHFYVMMELVSQKRTSKLQSLISKCSKVLRNKQSPFLTLTQAIFLFNQGKIHLPELIRRIQKVKDCRQRIINLKIQNIINQITKQHLEQFNKLSLLDQKKCFDIQINVLKQTFRSQHFLSLQTNYYDDMDKSFKLFLVQQNYFRIIGSRLQQQPFISQLYISLQNKLRHSDGKFNPTSNSLLMAHCFYTLIILLQRCHYDLGLKLAKHLYRVSCFTQHPILNQQSILQFIFTYIIHPMFYAGRTCIKQQNKSLYFDYQRLVDKKSKQQVYFSRAPIFVDIVSLMYKYRPKQVNGLISKTSKKLQVYNNKYNIQRYICAFQFIFIENSHFEYFCKQNTILYEQIQLRNNVYNIIPLHFINLHHLDRKGRKNHFIKIFTSLKYVSIYAKRQILSTIILTYMGENWDDISDRKRMRLNKLAIKYFYRLPLSRNILEKLLINRQARQLLHLECNTAKYRILKEVIRNFLIYLQSREKLENVAFKFEYNTISMRFQCKK